MVVACVLIMSGRLHFEHLEGWEGGVDQDTFRCDEWEWLEVKIDIKVAIELTVRAGRGSIGWRLVTFHVSRSFHLLCSPKLP